MRKGAIIGFYRAMRWCWNNKLRFVAKIIYYMIQLIFNCVIPPTVELQSNVRIAHAVGIVLHHETVINDGTTICQNVTIGNGKVHVGNNCLLGAGAVVIGPCNIGDNVKIGANTVVNFDVPSNSTVVGVKGKIIEH